MIYCTVLCYAMLYYDLICVFPNKRVMAYILSILLYIVYCILFIKHMDACIDVYINACI